MTDQEDQNKKMADKWELYDIDAQKAKTRPVKVCNLRVNKCYIIFTSVGMCKEFPNNGHLKRKMVQLKFATPILVKEIKFKNFVPWYKLIALDIKNKKKIGWLGTPTISNCRIAEVEKEEKAPDDNASDTGNTGGSS